MKTWKNWLKNKISEDSSADFGFGDDTDFADDHEKAQSDLFKAVLSKYPEETIAFLNSIADRGDEEVASLLKRVQKERGIGKAREPHHEKDQVIPSSADTGYNPESFGGDE